MSSSVHNDNTGIDILIIGKGPTKRLAGTTYTAEALYPINFRQSRKRFSLSLRYNKGNSFLFLNAAKIYSKQWTHKQKVTQCFKRFCN